MCPICCILHSPSKSSPNGLRSELLGDSRTLRGDLGGDVVPSITFISSPHLQPRQVHTQLKEILRTKGSKPSPSCEIPSPQWTKKFRGWHWGGSWALLQAVPALEAGEPAALARELKPAHR